MANRVVKLKRETVAACMTCPLCNKLFTEATTIPECLHTFCRKCIYDKISVEKIECCPICNTDLGCVLPEKLRPDHNLQDVRAKIFPFKKRKVKAPEIVPPVTLPARRKERSLSELVANAPKVSTRSARIVAELDDSNPTSRSMWTEVQIFKKRLELMFPLCDVEAGQTFQKSGGRFKALQMMTQSLCMAYGNALKDEERDVELEKLKEELNQIEDRLSDLAQERDVDQANLDLVEENADLRKEIASANNDLLLLRAEREIIKEELGHLRLKLSVSQHELEEEKNQAMEAYDYIFKEKCQLQESMKKQEEDRQIERDASATTIAALQSEVETLQCKREQDRTTAVQAHHQLNQTNQDLQARLEQTQKELDAKQREEELAEQITVLTTKVTLLESGQQSKDEALKLSQDAVAEEKRLREASDEKLRAIQEEMTRKDEANKDLLDRIAELKSQLQTLDELSIIRNWVHNHEAFKEAARHSNLHVFLYGAVRMRRLILKVYPDADLNKFRTFPNERILKNGYTLWIPSQFKPPVYLDNTPIEDREKVTPELHYESVDPVPNELELPAAFYANLRSTAAKIEAFGTGVPFEESEGEEMDDASGAEGEDDSSEDEDEETDTEGKTNATEEETNIAKYAQHEIEEEQTQAKEASDYIFEENCRLQESMKKQEEDRQIEREASATSIAALQSEVETLQRKREHDRMTIFKALNHMNGFDNQHVLDVCQQIHERAETDTKMTSDDEGEGPPNDPGPL